MLVRSLLLAVFAVAALAGTARAENAASAPTAAEKAFERSISYRAGTLSVRDARIRLPRGYRYLDAPDAQRTLTELYGNPPHPEVEAMILPPDTGVLTAGYFVVVTYDDDGHVDDDEAAGIDFDAMLVDMQAAEEDENADRAKQGYEPIHLVGWADTPHYDVSTHKLYWALDLKFGTSPDRTLNYEVRTLGREGMLSLNAVASIDDLAAVRAGMQTILGVSGFTEGRRYEDYQEGDRTSKLTVAAVVAGGAYAAAKTGLIAILLAKAKFLAIGLIAVAGAVWRRISNRRSDEEPESEAP